MDKEARFFEDNRKSWDSIAHMHAQGSGTGFYRIEQFLDGECQLGPWELEELGTVDGKSLLYLQCHIGTDTQSWARREAYKQQQEGSRYGRSVSMPLGFVSGDTGVAWLQSNKVFKLICLKSSPLHLQSIYVSEYPDNPLVLRPAPRLTSQRCQGKGRCKRT